MTASVLTKPRWTTAAMPSAMPLVLQPPRHYPALPLLLTPGEYSVGTDSGCDLAVVAEGVAARHAILVVNQFGVGLKALDGRTWVNDFAVTETTLRRGDRISLGPLTFSLRSATADDLLMQVAVGPSEPERERTPESVAAAPTDIEVAPAPIAPPAVDAVEIDQPVAGADVPPVEEPSVAAIVACEATTNNTVQVAIVVEPVPVAPTVTEPAQAAALLEVQIAAWELERSEQQAELALRSTELAALAAKLDERAAAWERERSGQQTELASRKSELAALATKLDERIAAWEQGRADQQAEITDRKTELVSLAARLDEKSAACETEHAEHQAELSARAAGLNEQIAAWELARSEQQSVLTVRKSELAELSSRLDERTAAWELERSGQQTELAARTTELTALAAELDEKIATWELERSEQQTELAALVAGLDEKIAAWDLERSQQQTELAARKTELTSREAGLDEKIAAWELERSQQQADLAAQKTELAALAAGLDERIVAWDLQQAEQQSKLAAREAELTALTAGVDEKIAGWEQARSGQQAELALRTTTLAALETELGERISRWETERSEQQTDLAARKTEFAALETGLNEQIAAWELERSEQQSELTARKTDLTALAAGLEEREVRLTSWEARLIRREECLDQRQSELDSQRTALDGRETALAEERLRLETVAATARAEIATEAEKQTAAWDAWEKTQRRLAAELNEEFEALQEVEAQTHAAKAALAAEQAAWRVAHEAWTADCAVWEARRQEQQQQLAEWEEESRVLEGDLTRQRDQLEIQRSELHAESCQRAAAHRELLEARQTTQRERRLFTEHQSAWLTERESQWLDLRERRRRLDADEREIAELHQQARDALEQALQTPLSAHVTEAIPAEPLVESPSEITAQSFATTQEFETAETHIDVTVDEQSALAVSPDDPRDPESASLNEFDKAENQGYVAAVELPDWFNSPRHEAVIPDGATDSSSVVSEVAEAEQVVAALESSPTVGIEPTIESDVAASLDDEPTSIPIDEFFALDRLAIAADQFVHRVDSELSADECRTTEFAEPSIPFDTRGTESETADAETDTMTADVVAAVEASPEADEALALDDSSAVEIDDGSGYEAASTSEDDLRAQLAKMFGLPEDFAQRHDDESEAPSLVETADTPEPELTSLISEETDAESQNDPASMVEAVDEAAADDEAWRAQLGRMMAVPAPPDATETQPGVITETRPALPESAPEPATSAPPAPSEEDTIAAYMERLLARNRMSSLESAGPDSAARTPTAPPVEPVRPLPLPEPLAADDDTVPESNVAEPAPDQPLLESRPRIDKDEVRAALQSFRQVANLSARSAIAQHSTKTLRGEIAVQGTLAGLAAIAAGAYWCGPLWGSAAQPLQGSGCLIAAGWMGWQISRTLNRLNNWNPNDRLEAQIFENPDDEDRDAIENHDDFDHPAAMNATQTTGDDSEPDLRRETVSADDEIESAATVPEAEVREIS